MKSLMLIGALLGFFIGTAFSLAQADAWPATLWHACAAAYLGSLMLRWWGHAWRKSLALSLEEKERAPQPPPSKTINPIPKPART